MSDMERLHRIKYMIQSRGCVPIEDFMTSLEISRATFKRDLDYLRDRIDLGPRMRPLSMSFRTFLGNSDSTMLPGLQYAIIDEVDRIINGDVPNNQLASFIAFSSKNADALIALYREIIRGYTEELSHLYKQGTIDHLNETEISTIINYNRELYTAYKSLILAAKDLIVPEKEATAFEELPGFIR